MAQRESTRSQQQWVVGSERSLAASRWERCEQTQVPVGDIGSLLGLEFVALAFVEAKRNEETDPVKRCYPGGAFDPMGMSKGDGFAKMKAKAGFNLAMCALASSTM